jgi:hypothetical protein
MSIRALLRTEAERFVARDECIQEVMWGTSIRPRLMYTGLWLFTEADSYRAIICTSRRIMLFRGGLWRATLEQLLATADRREQFGSPRGLFHAAPMFHPPVYIGRRFFGDIRCADATPSTPLGHHDRP